MDIGSAGGRQKGLSAEKLAAVANFERSPLFGDAERAALRFAELMCERTVEVPDPVFEELRRHFREPQIVEMAAMIALENLRARFNRAFEIESDGLCELAGEHPVMRSAARR